MEHELRGLDFNPEPVECSINDCTTEAVFIVKFKPHPHTVARWYPVCLAHVGSDSTCQRCPGRRYPRESIETL